MNLKYLTDVLIKPIGFLLAVIWVLLMKVIIAVTMGVEVDVSKTKANWLLVL